MTYRQPEPWQTNAPAPFLTIAVSALGDDRFLIEAPAQHEVIAGFPTARERAHALAAQLD